MSIHKPVVHLLKSGAALEMGPEERMECLHLIDAIVLKLKEDPVFVRLFFEETAPDGLPAAVCGSILSHLSSIIAKSV